MDSQGLSDPFCKVNVITPENNLRHTRWYKSRISHKTTNPEFNETFTFMGMSTEEINGSSLYVVILDDDKYGNDFLGAAKIPLGSVIMTCYIYDRLELCLIKEVFFFFFPVFLFFFYVKTDCQL